MKTLIFAFLSLFLVSCSSDDDNSNNQNAFENIQTDLPQGTWKVTSYIDDGENQTDLFTSFIFTFGEDGSVTATNDIYTETGTWQYDGASSGDDDEELILNFTATPPFDEISDDWDITSANSTSIVLFDQSGGDGSIDNLTFTKI